jgi:helicase
MNIAQVEHLIPDKIREIVHNQGIEEFRPSQFKAIKQGLFSHKNQLVCTPTGSGKTYVGELAFLDAILCQGKKAIYIVPLKALANEKYHEFTKRYSHMFQIARSIGDKDSSDDYLSRFDLIITTSEKLDSLIRHHAPWLKDVSVVIVDEIHQLNDSSRGPTLEIVITILRMLAPNTQIIGLSATIGNQQELANWLQAELVADSWRPTELHKGIYHEKEITFYESEKKKSS